MQPDHVSVHQTLPVQSSRFVWCNTDLVSSEKAELHLIVLIPERRKFNSWFLVNFLGADTVDVNTDIIKFEIDFVIVENDAQFLKKATMN